MSGRHRRPEADALADVDVAGSLRAGPVIEHPVIEHPVIDQPVVERPVVEHTVRRDRPVTIGTTIVGRRDRAAERAERRARARRRVLLITAVGGAVVLLLAGVAAVFVAGRGGDGGTDAERPGAKASASARQNTVLVQVEGEDGTAAASALVGIAPARDEASAVLVPSRLIVDVAGAGSLPFGETLTLGRAAAPGEALTDLLGVRVQNSWVLTTSGLAKLVDKVGGVQLQVDVDVVRTDAKGDETVVARAGSQKLAGPAAAAYATYLADGETEQLRLARFNAVFDAVLRGLPAEASDLEAALTGLAEGSTSSLAGDRLAALLLDLRTAAVKDRVRAEVLPVNDIDTGSDVESYGIDSAKAGTLLQSMFAASLLNDAAGESVRVLVENGVGTPGLVESARARLVDDGFRFVNGGNSSELSPTDPSEVLIADGTEKSQQRGARVAASLGLPSGAIRTNPRGQTVADVIVILGPDFKP